MIISPPEPALIRLERIAGHYGRPLRRGRGGRMETPAAARAAVDLAIIGVMADGGLRRSEGAAQAGGPGRGLHPVGQGRRPGRRFLRAQRPHRHGPADGGRGSADRSGPAPGAMEARRLPQSRVWGSPLECRRERHDRIT